MAIQITPKSINGVKLDIPNFGSEVNYYIKNSIYFKELQSKVNNISYTCCGTKYVYIKTYHSDKTIVDYYYKYEPKHYNCVWRWSGYDLKKPEKKKQVINYGYEPIGQYKRKEESKNGTWFFFGKEKVWCKDEETLKRYIEFRNRI